MRKIFAARNGKRIALSLIMALALMIASFAWVVEFGGAPPGAAYVPAHLENGKLIPGIVK